MFINVNKFFNKRLFEHEYLTFFILLNYVWCAFVLNIDNFPDWCKQKALNVNMYFSHKHEAKCRNIQSNCIFWETFIVFISFLFARRQINRKKNISQVFAFNISEVFLSYISDVTKFLRISKSTTYATLFLFALL